MPSGKNWPKRNKEKTKIYNKIKRLQFIASYRNQKLKPNNFLIEKTIFVRKIKK
jgi:hypothetical protein